MVQLRIPRLGNKKDPPILEETQFFLSGYRLSSAAPGAELAESANACAVSQTGRHDWELLWAVD